MKILAMVAMAVVLETGARADQVTVYIQGLSVVPTDVFSRAQVLANQMFAGAGVRIDWHRGGPGRSHSEQGQAIVIEMATDTPRAQMPDALAYALPYEGVHITVFYDRVRLAGDVQSTPNVLAHVLVHEITHILQGTCRHSATGVMKARYTQQDYREMKQRPLPFAEEDVQLIQFGLAQRSTGGDTLIAAVRH